MLLLCFETMYSGDLSMACIWKKLRITCSNNTLLIFVCSMHSPCVCEWLKFALCVWNELSYRAPYAVWSSRHINSELQWKLFSVYWPWKCLYLCSFMTFIKKCNTANSFWTSLRLLVLAISTSNSTGFAEKNHTLFKLVGLGGKSWVAVVYTSVVWQHTCV